MQDKLRDRLFLQIKVLNQKLNRLKEESDNLRDSGQMELREKLENTEIREIEKEIANKYSEIANSLDEDYGEKTLSLNDIFTMELPEQEWVINKLVPDMGITAISGVPGSYKSWLSTYIAKCLTEEKELFDEFKTIKGSVLFVDLENNLRLIKDRLKLLKLDSLAKVYYWKGGFSIEDDNDFKRLKNTIESKKIKLIIFDSLVRMHKGDENDG